MKRTLIGQIAQLPKSPGVYIYKDKNGAVLYVGKATSLRDRVKQYFPVRDRGAWIEKMVTEIEIIDHILCSSPLEALLREALEIHKLKPKYNTRLKDDKSFIYVIVSKNPKYKEHKIKSSLDQGMYPYLFTTRQAQAKILTAKKGVRVFGPFPSSKTVKDVLRVVRPLIFFSDKDPEKNYQMLIRFFSGRVSGLLKSLKDKMQKASKDQDFEKAALYRDRILSFENLGRMAEAAQESAQGTVHSTQENMNELRRLICVNPEYCVLSAEPFRIEAYDISHFGGKETVGSMVVFTDGVADRSQYRKFKIESAAESDDYAAMAEVIRRRLGHLSLSFRIGSPDSLGTLRVRNPEKTNNKKNEMDPGLRRDDVGFPDSRLRGNDTNFWSKPDLIILDGGRGHLATVLKVMREANVQIPVWAVAKGRTRKKLDVYTSVILDRSDSHRTGSGISSSIKPSEIEGQKKTNGMDSTSSAPAGLLVWNDEKVSIRQIHPSQNILRLIETIREEAHRFAITYQKKRREIVFKKEIGKK